MDNVYTLIAKRDRNGPGCLIIRYQAKKAALAAAVALREYCSTVTVVSPDGSQVARWLRRRTKDPILGPVKSGKPPGNLVANPIAGDAGIKCDEKLENSAPHQI